MELLARVLGGVAGRFGVRKTPERTNFQGPEFCVQTAEL